ncbi:flagellar assembly factor FliW [Ruminiclostridium sufflavum DSM 19573]|uniref:Flagellar assembly factor FliW n=1 Tax=Ruminiclostridium sufflavum DSM 19573 TaxID=1121337 RepID=A0A318XPX5_9FIRM|nr:flagellar assembly protein FliW [Ruminiclostridium sufflavum]PYG89115.1 flagellar assembly factor FliW [Ruminiclostridium sufflavum DSM 19573]
MIVETKHFGKIEMKEENIVVFEEGIPGFEDIHRYGIINNEDPESPFCWIQAMEKQELAFALVDPFAIKKDYDFELNDENVAALGIEEPSQVEVYAVVVVPEDVSKISMNLKAPVIINKKNKKAAQVVLNSDKYTVRHFIIDELQNQEV